MRSRGAREAGCVTRSSHTIASSSANHRNGQGSKKKKKKTGHNHCSCIKGKNIKIQRRVCEINKYCVPTSHPVSRIIVQIRVTRLMSSLGVRGSITATKTTSHHSSAHSKNSGRSANHSSLVKRRISPLIRKRTFGTYGLPSPLLP